ncbi:MAG: Gfo/Idh/MocA family oxidoreductase [Pseudomonadota bacterium]
MSETRTYAIIGCGMMGREHMRNLALIDEAELIAIADPDAASLEAAKAQAAALGQSVCLFEDSAEMMAETKPDAVIIASPNFTHYDVVKAVMEASAAVLLEKPMCTRVEDARALAEAARNYGNLFWVGLEYRYMPPVTRFIERVHAGEAGDIKMLSIREHRFPFLVKVGDWNRFNRNTGGTLVEKCCHFFDLMRHILRDEPVRVFASGAQDVNHLDERYAGEVPDIIDNAFVLVDFAGGARAMLDLCMFAEGSEEQEEISAVGPVGKLEVKLPSGEVTWSPRSGTTDSEGQRVPGCDRPQVETVVTPPDALAAGSHHGATFYQQRDFHAALVGGSGPLIDARDGYRSVAIGNAAQQSIATGQPVDIYFEDED